jgi:hypothetical protein
VLPGPAQSKGLEAHARVTIRGTGLAEPIRLNGDDASLFVERSAAFQAKWDVPNLGGDLMPDAELGTAYRAAVRMRCWNGKVVRYTQTLYPEAPGGLQVLTPPGAGRCFGLVPGYWSASNELLSLLLTNGLPAGTGEHGTDGERPAAQAVPADGGSGGSFEAGLAITFALAAAFALLGVAVGLAIETAAGHRLAVPVTASAKRSRWVLAWGWGSVKAKGTVRARARVVGAPAPPDRRPARDRGTFEDMTAR